MNVLIKIITYKNLLIKKKSHYKTKKKKNCFLIGTNYLLLLKYY